VPIALICIAKPLLDELFAWNGRWTRLVSGIDKRSLEWARCEKRTYRGKYQARCLRATIRPVNNAVE
ncbi:hypothetical protein CWM53_30330, partial [Klebsiella sp. A-Nf5]